MLCYDVHLLHLLNTPASGVTVRKLCYVLTSSSGVRLEDSSTDLCYQLSTVVEDTL